MTLKEQMADDLEQIFYNTDEFAEAVSVVYDGREYRIPIADDTDAERDREVYKEDNEIRVYVHTRVIRVRIRDMDGVVPEKNTSVTIDGERYSITSVQREAGEAILELGRFED